MIVSFSACFATYRPLSDSPGNKDRLVGVGSVHVLPSDVPNVSSTTTLNGLGVVVAREHLRDNERPGSVRVAVKSSMSTHLDTSGVFTRSADRVSNQDVSGGHARGKQIVHPASTSVSILLTQRYR